MKHPILFALIFSFTAFSAEARNRTVVIKEEIGYVLPAAVKTRTAAEARALAPVAQQISRQQLATGRPSYSGILPRMAVSGRPAAMLSPFAPRDYGAGWNLMSITNHDPYRPITPYSNSPQPMGLRVFGVHGIW